MVFDTNGHCAQRRNPNDPDPMTFHLPVIAAQLTLSS